MEYIDIFKEVYLDIQGIPFTQINGREGKSMKELYLNINSFWKEKTGQPLEINQTLDAFKHFLESIEDPFILDIFTPSLILQHYQQILSVAYGKSYAQEEKKKARVANFFRRYTQEEQDEILFIQEAYKRQQKQGNEVTAGNVSTGLGQRIKDKMNYND